MEAQARPPLTQDGGPRAFAPSGPSSAPTTEPRAYRVVRGLPPLCEAEGSQES